MNFEQAISNIKTILEGVGSSIDENAYDGVIVKRLESSNTLDAGRTTKQSHIAITGAQMDMFPYVRADGYFEVAYENEDADLKKFFVAQIPAYLHKENIEYLGEDIVITEPQELVHISIVRSRRNNAADQIQMSMTYMDSPKFVEFRRSVHAGSYLIMLKRAKELLYDIYAVKVEDINYGGVDLSAMNNIFSKGNTNTVVKLDEIIINSDGPKEDVDTPSEDANNEDWDEYQRAAHIIRKYGEEHGLMDAVSDDSIQAAIDDFNSKYTPDRLNNLSDDEILSHMFITIYDNSNALCYWLENKDSSKEIFGKIGVGSCLHYGLYQDHSSGKWTTKGDTDAKKELTDAEALVKAKEIRDRLVLGAKLIEESKLESVSDYEALFVELNKILGDDFINMQWVHKYYSVLFPHKLSSYHSPEWQKHVLFSLGIVPGDNIYVRSGQISMVQNHINLIYRKFSHIFYAKYGRPKTFLRIGTTGSRNFIGDWKKESVVGIGWSDVGSLVDYATNKDKIDKDKLYDAMSSYYPNDATNHTKKTNELISFYEADSDCIFVPADGEKIYALVDNIGDYAFDKNQEFAHLRRGNWIMCFPSEGIKLPSPKDALQTSCRAFKKDENLFYLYQAYYSDNEEIEDETVIEENEKLKNCLDVEREERTNKIYPLNFIVYGAPGTGKTYSMVEYALAIIDNVSIDDFRAKNPNRKTNVTRYKALVRSGQIVFTTFHQNYGYEEFIQGLRPDKDSEVMAFKTVDGVFKVIADTALNDSEGKNFVIIIDEINRANISKVFGELITLIEEDKRWGELNETSATLQSGDPFAVPNNLYIVGTMNSADKSISLIDAALRRRFDFIEQKPDAELVIDEVLKSILKNINLRLVKDLDSTDLLVGHSYFMNKTQNDLPSILNNNIIPLLYEYYYDDRKKVRNLLESVIKDSGASVAIVDEEVGRLRVKGV